MLLAGHLDTVPAQGNLPGRIEDGWVVGLGASDMKGGLAVMIELARWIAARSSPRCATTLPSCSSSGRSCPTEESALPRVFAEAPLVTDSDLVVMLEPTDNEIHAGCLGNLNATLVFEGRSAHSARPWQGVNAIGLAVEGLRPVVAAKPVEVDVGGLTFVEVLSATRISGGIADNVIPDRVEVGLNYRYAPGRTREEAETRLRELVGGRGRDHLELASGARRRRLAARRRLIETGGLEVRAEAGVDAGCRVRRPGARRRQPRPRRATLCAPARRAGRDRRAGTSLRCAAALPRRLTFARWRSPPLSPRQGTYPFVRIERAKREAAAAGIEILDFGQGDPREPTDPAIRQALVDALAERMGYPKAEGLPELREAIAGWCARRFGVALDPDGRGDPDLRQQGGDLQLRAVHGRPERPARHRRRHRARLSGAGPGRGLRRRARRGAAAARAERLPPRPRGDRRLGPGRASLGQLPEQPDRSARAGRVLRASRGARARARLPALLRRGVQRAVVHGTAGLGAPGRRPDERRRLPDALEALLDDRLPVGVRRRGRRT